MKKKPEEEIATVAPVAKVAPLTSDFSRQDLNELRDKLNEVIAIINT